ncbi:hypothetical protein ACWE42_19275 [Sutcliffiella cohnii]
MGNHNDLRESFFAVINRYYPTAKIINPRRSQNPNRKEIIVGNRRKRWMKIDDNKQVLNISMDHYVGAITNEDVEKITMHVAGKNKYKLDFLNDGKFDAVHFSFRKDTPYDFNNKEFLEFLEKQYRAYMKL